MILSKLCLFPLCSSRFRRSRSAHGPIGFPPVHFLPVIIISLPRPSSQEAETLRREKSRSRGNNVLSALICGGASSGSPAAESFMGSSASCLRFLLSGSETKALHLFIQFGKSPSSLLTNGRQNGHHGEHQSRWRSAQQNAGQRCRARRARIPPVSTDPPPEMQKAAVRTAFFNFPVTKRSMPADMSAPHGRS